MAVGFLCTTNLLSKSSGMGVHHPAMPIGPYMHFSSVVAPTPTPSMLPEERSKALGAGQLGTGCWIQKLCAHAHDANGCCTRRRTMSCTPGSSVQRKFVSWKNFLKSFLALLMGYGKTRETNLTKEKIMGFDLHSTGNHKSEKGEYFRNNVWGWRRLADFVCTQTGVVQDEHKKFWQSNDGHEVTDQEALQIAKQLKALIKDGTVSKAIHEVEEETKKAEENNKFVDECHRMLRDKVERETGKTNLAPADYPKEDHDTWDWIQSKYDYASSYPFTMENVEEFIEFCEQSNGFRIC